MTRFLSESLQAPEPFFRLGLRRLESANGHPGTDIRFSSEVVREGKAKLRELGLDPSDTTAEELYHVLQARIKADDARLTRTLQTRAATHVSAEADVIAGMIHVLQDLPDSKKCFALKSSVLKSIMKKVPPKKAMKALGYRSLDSFLKHETAISVLAAGWLSEGSHWQEKVLDQYKRLKSSDFEDRTISFVHPQSARWRTLAARVVANKRHNLLSFKEMGAVVFLPLPAHAPAGSTTVSMSLALHELNEIRASSTFLKLCQVRPDFGVVVRSVIIDEAQLSSKVLDQPMPWHLVQRYYARLTHSADEEQVFEPHIQMEDIAWHPIEETLKAIEPSFAFWHQAAHLGFLDARKPVSFNVIDAALNFCNQLPFEQRTVHYFQRSLWHELLLRYLHRESVEQAVSTELLPHMAMESITA